MNGNSLENQISYICKNEYEYFLSKKNVVGVALGYKFIKGFYTCEKCITVFVCKKEAVNILNISDLIPKTYKGISTDVVESGMFFSQSLTERVRPTICGYSIGNSVYTGVGTLGCIVTDGHDYYILSNNHLLASYNTLPLGTAILQPGKRDGGNPDTDVIATLAKFIPLKFNKTFTRPVNYVDCAIAKVVDKSMVSSKIALIGDIKGLINPSIGQSVKKVGRTTELTRGKVINTDSTINFYYTKVQKNALLKEQIITTIMSRVGDSGSVLLDDNNRALGLLIGGGTTISIYNFMPNVLNELKVTFA